jgi:hypothetical protein
MLKFVRVCAILLVAWVLAGCSRDDPPEKKRSSKDRSEQKVVKAQIRAALIRLLERKIEVMPGEPGLPPFEHRPFVVFEDAGSKKFVQFSGSIEEPLVFDLPSQTLNVDERIRADEMWLFR